jgi:hypothetical protein
MKLGSDKISWAMSSYKLKNHLWGSKLIKNVEKCVMKKVDGSWFFWSDFDEICPKTVLLGFIEKQAPQKALCLGPDPPPGTMMKIIEI